MYICIYIFQVAMFLKTGVYIYIYIFFFFFVFFFLLTPTFDTMGRFSLGLLSAIEAHLIRICSVHSFLRASSKSDLRFDRSTHPIYLHV